MTLFRKFVFLLFLLPCLPTHGQQRSLKEMKVLMHGEDVLDAQRASLLNPICRNEEHPWYEVSNIRPGNTLSEALKFDFVRSGSAAGKINAIVVARGDRLRFPMASSSSSNEGTFTCSYRYVKDKTELSADVEVYIELVDADPVSPRSGGTGANPLYFKVSRSATRGSVSTITKSREINANERAIFEARLKKYGPPPPAPKGYKTAKSHWPIVPGTPVLVAYQGTWYPGEGLGTYDKRLVVEVPDLLSTFRYSYGTFAYDAVALADGTIQDLVSKRHNYSPSVKLAEGSIRRMPEGYERLPLEEKLPKGMPIKDFSWGEMLVQEDLGDSLVVYWLTNGRTETKKRNQFCVRSATLAKRNDKAQLETWAKSLDATLEAKYEKARQRAELVAGGKDAIRERMNQARMRAGVSGIRRAASNASVRNYDIKIPIPEGYKIVRHDSKVEVGDVLMVSYSGKWDAVPVMSLREYDNAIEIYWESWRNCYFVSRHSLIMREKDEVSAKDAEKTGTSEAKDETEGSAGGGEYTVNLDSAKMDGDTAKMLMDIADMDLPMVVEILKVLPIKLKKGLTKSEAEALVKKVEAVGGKASIKK